MAEVEQCVFDHLQFTCFGFVAYMLCDKPLGVGHLHGIHGVLMQS